jgi:pyruvate,water dikinase
VWDNSNIVESYSGVTTPLTFSFAREIYPPVYRQFCRMMGVSRRAIRQHEDVFDNVLGLIRGRLYYNLLNWYRILALLPGYRLNRPFMEQMMGVSEPLPDDDAEVIAREVQGSRWRELLHLPRTALSLLATYVTLDRRIAAFYRRLDDALAAPSPRLEARTPDELVAHYQDLRRRLLLSWDAPLANDFFAMVAYGALGRLLAKWCGSESAALRNDLIAGSGGMISAEPVALLQTMAQLASADPRLIERLTTEDVATIQAALGKHPELAQRCAEYLDKFGDRTFNELKLESLTLHDEPLPLFRAIGSLARQVANTTHHEDATASASAGRRIAAQAQVARALDGHPVRRLVLGWVLRAAARRVRDRENLRLERTRLFARVRAIFLELGRRFCSLALLESPRDIFYLEVGEVLALVDGRSTTIDLKSLVALRRNEFAAHLAGPAPDARFETRGLVYRGHSYACPASARSVAQDERRGLGCSPGIVRGRVRVVTDPRTVSLDEPAILVARHTDPGWVLVFPFALAVIVERGSPLSHAAIVARELGIPAVVSVSGATEWLEDGECVEVDGSSGRVRRITQSEPSRPVKAEPESAVAHA